MRLTAAAYWGPRKESSEDCARRATLFFEMLAKSSPLLRDWFERGWSKPKTLKAVDTSEANIRKLFEASNLSHRNKINEERRAGLGFRIAAWNGKSDEHEVAGIMIGCGKFSERLNNAVVVDLPTRFVESEDFGRKKLVILRALVASWEPDWAAIYDVHCKKGHEPFLDLALYISCSFPIPEALDTAEGVVRETFDKGFLFLRNLGEGESHILS
jgi:hypothetical protein